MSSMAVFSDHCSKNLESTSLYADFQGCQINHSLSKLIRLCRTSFLHPASTKSVHPCKYGSKIKEVAPQESRSNRDDTWMKLQEESLLEIRREPILLKYYHSTILQHTSLESALSHYLAIKLSSSHLSIENLYEVFLKAFVDDDSMKAAVRDDLKAAKDWDPACVSFVHCFLNYKGFLACQAHRVAHKIWLQGRKALAFLIQSRVSEVLAIDIHPGAQIGTGLLFDHATGIVIGETAVIGNNVTILHDVTLGGTGKVRGDRHPKIGDGVLIGSGAKILGSIIVGDGAKIGAGAVVLIDVPPRATAVGNPARSIKDKDRAKL